MVHDNETPTADGPNTPSDWLNDSPNQVIARLKLMKAEVLEQYGLRPFYKSYSQWEKMTTDQRNKSIAWFRKLPDHLKGKYICLTMFVFCLILFLILFAIPFPFSSM